MTIEALAVKPLVLTLSWSATVLWPPNRPGASAGLGLAIRHSDMRTHSRALTFRPQYSSLQHTVSCMLRLYGQAQEKENTADECTLLAT